MSSTNRTRYYDTTFEDYLATFDRFNIHPELDSFRSHLPDQLSDLPNLIVYGSAGTGRYTQVLTFLRKYSPSALRYDTKIYMTCDKIDQKTSTATVVRDAPQGLDAKHLLTTDNLEGEHTARPEFEPVELDAVHYSPVDASYQPRPSSTSRKTQRQKPTAEKKATKSISSSRASTRVSSAKQTAKKVHTSESADNTTTVVTAKSKRASELAYRISDIHYEVDLPSLGCNAKILWHEIYYHIVDIISASPLRKGVIVCKNFHLIHNELLAVFYSYMHHPVQYQYNICIRFVLITDHMCLLPPNITNSCFVVPVRRPSISVYKKMATINLETDRGRFLLTPTPTSSSSRRINVDILDHIDLSSILNLKEVLAMVQLESEKSIPDDMFCKVVAPLYEHIIPTSPLNIYALRNRLYNLLIFGIDVHETVWYILTQLVDDGYIGWNEMHPILENVYEFFTHYNNNYRSIYHMERIFLYISEQARNKIRITTLIN
jgi:hypothetical protein